jgi:tRNA-specific 2-thiouridylase
MVPFWENIKGTDIALGKPVFVTRIDPDNNTVTLGDENDLDQQEMLVSKINLLKYEQLSTGMEATTKIRYKDAGTLSTLYPENTTCKVRFYEAAKGVAPGQSAVFYEGDDVLGGGIIQRTT